LRNLGLTILFALLLAHGGVAQSTTQNIPTLTVGVSRGGFAWMCRTCGGGFPEGGWAGTLSASLPTGHRLRPWLGGIHWTNPAEGFSTITAGVVGSVIPRVGLFVRASAGIAFWSTPAICLAGASDCGGTSVNRAPAASLAVGTMLPVTSALRPVLWVGYDRSLGEMTGSGAYQIDMHLVSVGLGLAWAK
jgi:hypothetical protein